MNNFWLEIKVAFATIMLLLCTNISKAQNNSVGETSINVSVDAMGGANASIPIYCPPGRLGLQPQVSLNYNSNSGDGLLGKNISFSGTSVITRTGTNYHLDEGSQREVSFQNALDKFSIDGNRLVWVGDDFPGGTKVKYRTEADQFSEITFLGDRFIVKTKDGGTLFYGANNNSTLIPSGGTVGIAYYLYRKYDIDGNYIEYDYTMSNGSIQLAEIRYTGFDCTINNTKSCAVYPAISPYNKVVFLYTQGTPSNQSWVRGKSLFSNKIIHEIDVFESTNKIRQYDFTYTNNGISDFLQSVQEKNSSSNAFEPITFLWPDDEGTTVKEDAMALNNMGHDDYSQTYAGDFNGDGKSDLLVVEGLLDIRREWLLSSDVSYKIYSEGQTQQKFNGNVINKGRLLHNGVNSPNIPQITNIMVGDIDQDGMDDLLLQAIYTAEVSNPNQMKLHVYYHAMIATINTSGKLDFKIIHNYFAPYINDEHSGHEMFSTTGLRFTPYLLDCDGDGKLDLVELAKKETTAGEYEYQYLNVVYGKSTQSRYLVGFPRASQLPIYGEYFGDFNGNGKADLMVVFGTYTSIIEADQSNGNWSYLYYEGGFPQAAHKAIQLGDFNGDSKTDLFYYVFDAWHIAYSKGTVYEEHDATTEFGIENISPDHYYSGYADEALIEYTNEYGIYFHLGDFNGDGKTDILQRHYHPVSIDGHSADYRDIYYSKGIGFSKVNFPGIGNQNKHFDYNYSLLADFDGDGKTDILAREYAANRRGLEYYQSVPVIEETSLRINLEYFTAKSKHVGQIKPTSYKHHLFTFKPLPRSSQYKRDKEKPLGFDQAVTLAAAKCWVTESYTQSVDNTTLNKTFKYYYQNMMFHRHGRGMMGFEKTATVEQHSNVNMKTTSITESSQDVEYSWILNASKTLNYRTSTVVGNFVSGSDLMSDKVIKYMTVRTLANNTAVMTSLLAQGAGSSYIDPIKKIRFQYASTITETDYLTKVRKNTCFQYDENGNLYLTREMYYGVDKFYDIEHTSTMFNAFEQKGTWLPSTVQKTKSTDIRYEDAGNTMLEPHENQVEFVNNIKGRPDLVQHFVTNQSLYIGNYFYYDKFGNTVQEKIDYVANQTGNPITQRVVTYDAQGRFIIAMINVLGQELTCSYEPVYGNKLSETGVDGLTTTYSYDNWGRMISSIGPNGVETTINRDWLSTALPSFIPGLTPMMYIHKSNTLGEEGWEYYDYAGRKIVTKETGFNGNFVYTDLRFDDENRAYKQSNNYTIESERRYTETNYDIYGRPSQQKFNDVIMARYAYDKTATSVTTGIQGRSAIKTTTQYATGHTSMVSDNGGEIIYKLGSHNLPLSIETNGVTTTFVYDEALRQTQLCDPDAGCSQYEYNALRQLVTQTDARNNTYTMEYDLAGRLTKKTGGNNEQYDYAFYATTGTGSSVNKVQSATLSVNGSVTHSVEYEYDALGNITSVSEGAPGEFNALQTTYTYDSYGRPLKTYYPNMKTQNVYDAFNNFVGLRLIEQLGNTKNVMLWEKNKQIPDGRTSQFTLGNGFVTSYSFDYNWQLSSIISSNSTTGQTAIQSTYNFEVQSGNLTSRNDRLSPIGLENFYYDESDRLNRIDLRGKDGNYGPPPAFPYAHNIPYFGYDIKYEDNGNITGKYDAGHMRYREAKPHAVIENEMAEEYLIPRITPTHYLEAQTLTYTAFNKVQTISQAAALNINIPVEIQFKYGVDQQRISMEIHLNGGTPNTTRYINSADMEIVGGNEVTYIYAEGKPIAMHRKSDDKIYYLHTDYQNSLVAISREDGVVVETRSYDAWGRPRNKENYDYILPSPFGGSNSSFTLRGYTFHEHLEMVGLINMNARCYDPVLGRMLSPDNFVQDATSTQNLNRYSYCLNNPTKYTDPDGNWVNLVIGAVVGGAAGYQIGKAKGASGWALFAYTMTGAAIGTATSGFAAGISAAGGSALGTGATAGAIGNASFTALAGGNAEEILGAAGKGLIAGGVGGALGAAIGGSGGAFFGAATASGINSKMNGASWKDAGVSAIGGGALGFGIYQVSSFAAWRFEGGSKWGDLDVSFKQYKAMQADFQRSRFWGREYGGYLLNDGGVKRASPGGVGSIDMGSVPSNAVAEYHTHWDEPGQIRWESPDGRSYENPDNLPKSGSGKVIIKTSPYSRYHSDIDWNTGGLKSLVINRYDGSYYSGAGPHCSTPINPPIARYTYSYYFWGLR